jgi:hypothetical protein
MIDRQIASNKNYKKIFETRFSIGNQEKLKKAQAVDLRNWGGPVLGTQVGKIEFGSTVNILSNSMHIRNGCSGWIHYRFTAENINNTSYSTFGLLDFTLFLNT